jgi:Holliday junction resolvase RusA-like endonuclease
MKLVIVGAPRTKKNSGRIFRNKATGAPMFMPSEAGKRWEASAAYQLMNQWRREPIAGPVHVSATFYRERAVGDLVNFMQALADALQVAKVVTDDKWIVSWDGTRLAKDPQRPRVEVEIQPMDEGRPQ